MNAQLNHAIAAAFSPEDNWLQPLEEPKRQKTAQNSECLPRSLLIEMNKTMKGAWKLADERRALLRSQGASWPKWCFMPLAEWLQIADQVGGAPLSVEEPIDRARLLAAFGTWRVTQGIYRFPEALEKALLESSIEGEIPGDVLETLPEWCVYVEGRTGNLNWDGSRFEGFFASLELVGGAMVLMLTFLEQASFLQVLLTLTGRSIEQMLAGVLVSRESETGGSVITNCMGEELAGLIRLVESALSLLLFICSQAGKIGTPTHGPGHPEPRSTKRGTRYFPPDLPTHWDVGVRYGAALQAGQQGSTGLSQGGTHAPPKCHIRRAHWHTYRTGPGRQNCELRWLPPIAVNLKSVDELLAVIRPVAGVAEDAKAPVGAGSQTANDERYDDPTSPHTPTACGKRRGHER